MKNYFKNIKNKEFIISIICLMGVQAAFYAGLKLLQADFRVLNYDIDNKIPFIPQVILIYNLFLLQILRKILYLKEEVQAICAS